MSELDDVEQDLRRRFQRRRIIFIVVVALLGLGSITPCLMVCGIIGGEIQEDAERREERSHRATPEQIAAVDDATRQLEASLPSRNAAWQTAMAGAATLGPSPELGPCPTKLPLRQPAEAARGGSFNNLDDFTAFAFPGQQGFPHAVAGAGLPAQAPRVELARRDAAEMRELIRREQSLDFFTRIVANARALATEYWTYDVVFFPSEYRRPHAEITGNTFTPGSASGTAVLFDYASGRPLCAGDVERVETTSQVVDYQAQIGSAGMTLQGMLDAEFDAEVERAIARAVRWRAAPRAPQ